MSGYSTSFVDHVGSGWLAVTQTTMAQSTVKDFSFPGNPYPVQNLLMSAIHSAMEQRQIGLFESPTGTGKTLSIICSTLTWLSEHRHATERKVSAKSESTTLEENDEPDWVVAHSRAMEERKSKDEFFRRRDAYHRRVNNSKRAAASKPKKRRSTDEDDIFSDSDTDEPNRQFHVDKRSQVRIIFATRTHSQLQQFLDEIRKTSFSPPQVVGDDHFKKGSMGAEEDVPLSVLPFGSRKQFCINEEVRNLSSSAAISERCRELTEASDTTGNRKRSRNRCQYKNPETEEILRDRALVQMHSIEELVEQGHRLGACPYFASRAALEIGDVDVIGVPYSAVLHRPTRESLGITIDENTVVVFDEAHNIVNTVCDLHSSTLTRPALVQTINALKEYVTRYETRFSPSNLYKLRQLLTLAKGLLALLPASASEQRKGRVVQPSAILFDAGVDNINMYALVAYIEESKLCKKLRGFVDSGLYEKCKQSGESKGRGEKRNTIVETARDDSKVSTQRETKQSVLAFESFLRCISDCSPDGRVAIYPYKPNERQMGSKTFPLDATARMKYFVVSPGNLFAASIAQARAVLMLGGTMSPRAVIKQRLLAGLDREVVEFECDHVVPAENVMTRVCGIGPTKRRLEFTYRTRKTVAVCDELALAVEKCVSMVNGGVVMFVASYEHLRETLARWRVTGALEKIGCVKPVYVEERGSNEAFGEYQAAVQADKSKGALLIGVMGGKLSEGINFSDELGRMVIMVGMPFANAGQVEIGEVLKGVGGVAKQSEFLENQCMTVVNQCIGRAVRHANDFASIILMDGRYGRPRVLGKLPKFVRRDVRVAHDFEGLEHDVRLFFERKGQ